MTFLEYMISKIDLFLNQKTILTSRRFVQR